MVHIKDSVHIVLDINEQRCLEMIFDKVGFQFPLTLFYLVIIPGLKENIFIRYLLGTLMTPGMQVPVYTEALLK